MSAPLIAIPTYHLGPGRVGDWTGAYALPEPYVTALCRAGARPVLLPTAQPADAAELLEPFHGLLLAGGGDIDPGRDGAQLLHPLRVLAGSRLAGALGREQVEGLSHHHQGLDRLGDGFRAVAWSPDGLVEGIERERGWTVGVLWHPESTADADPAQRHLLRSFVAEASRRGLRFWNPGAEPVGSRGPGPGS